MGASFDWSRQRKDSRETAVWLSNSCVAHSLVVLGFSGVLANAIFPNWIITCLLIVLLFYITFLAVRKAVTLHRNELMMSSAASQHPHPSKIPNQAADGVSAAPQDLETVGLLSASAQAVDFGEQASEQGRCNEASTADGQHHSRGLEQYKSRALLRGQEMFADPPPPKMARTLAAAQLKVKGPLLAAAERSRPGSVPPQQVPDAVQLPGSFGSLQARLLRPSIDSLSLSSSRSAESLPAFSNSRFLDIPGAASADELRSDRGSLELSSTPRLAAPAEAVRKLPCDSSPPAAQPSCTAPHGSSDDESAMLQQTDSYVSHPSAPHVSHLPAWGMSASILQGPGAAVGGRASRGHEQLSGSTAVGSIQQEAAQDKQHSSMSVPLDVAERAEDQSQCSQQPGQLTAVLCGCNQMLLSSNLPA